MARENLAAALALIFRHEGGYVDHPLDPGGATNRGITRATLARHRGRPVSKAEVLALSEAEAAAIYRASYWNAVRADNLPSGIDLVVFDAAVNSGPARALRWLQASLGLPATGLANAATLAAAHRADQRTVIEAFSRQRLSFLQRLSTWASFGRGWSARVAQTRKAALALAGPGRLPSGRNKETKPVTEPKSLFTSRTVWANLVGLAAVLLSIFGFDTSTMDSPGMADAIAQSVAGISFVASTIFRVIATRRLAMM
jgi:lysozyme family protein